MGSLRLNFHYETDCSRLKDILEDKDSFGCQDIFGCGQTAPGNPSSYRDNINKHSRT